MSTQSDTIVAVSSAPGPGARGIVRISGPCTWECLTRCFHRQDDEPLELPSEPSTLTGTLTLSDYRHRLPCEVLIWPGQQSYTREPLAEIHTWGASVLLDSILGTLCDHGARPAAPGEFTLRAFLAGRIDLTQAEAVLGVIEAADRRELNVALGQLAGGLAARLTALRDRLLDVLAHLEAGLDFVEEDIEFITPSQLSEAIETTLATVRELLDQLGGRGEARQELAVVLCGEPSVGKSSLFNALLTGDEHPRALVDADPGTTRDYLTARMALGQRTARLIDTAGQHADGVASGSHRDIQTAAETQARQQTSSADVVLWCLDASRPLSAWERTQLEQATLPPNTVRLVVLNKCDLPERHGWQGAAIRVSAVTGTGLETLRCELM